MKTYELNCTYGSSKTKNTVYVYENRDGSKWYAVDGSLGVNQTYDDMEDGVNVEELSDVDTFTYSSPINSIDELIEAVEN